MDSFNHNISILSQKIGTIHFNDYNQKLYDSYRKRDEENEILFYSSFPKTIISENLKLGFARVSGYSSATKRRNIIEVARRHKDKWVILNKSTGEAYAVTSAHLEQIDDIKDAILNIVNTIDEQKNKKMIEDNPETKRKLIGRKTELKQVINKPNFLNTYHNAEKDKVKFLALSEDTVLMKRDDAVNILGLTPIERPSIEESTPIIEEMEESGVPPSITGIPPSITGETSAVSAPSVP